jgi:hypothetical protein
VDSHVLNLLKGLPDPKDKHVSFEYRLLCSGELYNGSVLTSDWRKSTAARILCDVPFSLLVVSNPFDDFPQELALRFSAPLTTEKHGNSTSIFHPDDEIARDVAALLTLVLRRLVTVATKTREVHPRAVEGDIEALLDHPTPLVKSLAPVHWEHKPSSVIHRFGQPPEITDYNPRPLGVNFAQLKAVLTGLPAMPLAECVVLSARLYSLALTQLEHDIDLTYQLLIAAVEATASVALKDYRPDDDQIVANKDSVAKLARSFGLGESEARQLAIEACKGISWASRKFSKFLVENCTDDIWSEDDVFRIPPEFVPSPDDFEKAIGQIYTARGRLTHGGRSFPASSVLGMGPTVPAKAIMSFDWSTKPFPPVAWFERVVNDAFRGFINRSLPPQSPSAERSG